ncbi:MAG: GNAT family N-acetyltransferase [Dermatophilaceae bacterium]
MEQDARGSAGRGVPLPWLGARVVIRSRLPAPDPATGATRTDVVGILVATDDARMTLATRRGEVTVARADVVAVKEVPPAPSRRGPPHRALSVDDLQRAMVGAWPAVETAPLGDWLLRAARGFTHRANSVMTAGDPGRPLRDAVDEVETWYRARGLAPMLTAAGEVGTDLADSPLGAELSARGYPPRQPTLTLTAATAHVATVPGRSALPVTTTTRLTAEWLAAYGAYRPVDKDAARSILTGSPEQIFATVADNGEIVGVGRLGISAAWGGIAAMWVHPRVRGRGVGLGLLAELATAARRRGIRSLHLQVDADNAAALALYARSGFEPHHHYTTFAAPPPDNPGRRPSAQPDADQVRRRADRG